ncbi:MAG: hypothetical protein FJ137_21715 [Deltaproteobacteria bacterium]|nr:hypothetical protein [Deltaproteobacteria bacterium]
MTGALLLPLILGVASVDPRVVEAQQLAAHGETSAARGQYAAILDDLQAAGAPGSAALHYDLGTLALVDGDVGAAMLHLLAASRRDPGHEDIAYNLARAQEARQDRVESSTSSPASWASALGGRLPPRGVRVVAGLVAALLGLVLALRGALGPRVPPAMTVGAAAVASLAFAAWGARSAFERRAVVVVVEATTARSSPDAQAAGFDVHPGLSGERVDEAAGWWRVRLENGLDVWVDVDAARLVP